MLFLFARLKGSVDAHLVDTTPKDGSDSLLYLIFFTYDFCLDM